MKDVKVEYLKDKFNKLVSAIWNSKNINGHENIEGLHNATLNGNFDTNKMNKFDDMLIDCQKNGYNYYERFADVNYMISIYRKLKIQEEVDKKLNQEDSVLHYMMKEFEFEEHEHDISLYDSNDNKLTSSDLFKIIIKMKEVAVGNVEINDDIHSDKNNLSEVIATDIVISNYIYIKDITYSDKRIVIHTIGDEVPVYNAKKTLFYTTSTVWRDGNTTKKFSLRYANNNKENESAYHSDVVMINYKQDQQPRLSMKRVEEYLDSKDLKVSPKGDIVYTKEMDDNTLELVKIYLKTKLSQDDVVEIVFEKKNGDIRVLKGTLADDYLKEHFDKYEEYKDENKPLRKESVSSCAVFDVEINQFRAVSLPNLISINGIKIEKLLNVI